MKIKLCTCTALLHVIRLYGLLMIVMTSMVEGDYQLQVTVHSFTLLRNRCATCFRTSTAMPAEMADRCCDSDTSPPPPALQDGSCAPQCDVLFLYCNKRPLGTPENTKCPSDNSFNSAVYMTDANGTFWFDERIIIIETPNPVTFNETQTKWEGTQFYMEFIDRDFDDGPDDLIDTLAVDVDIPVGSSISRTTYTGRFNNTQVELSFRVVCAENYYGPDCTRLCNDSICPCDPGYTGEFCEMDITVDPCAGINCNNKGQCVQNVSSFSCHCNPGFTGEMCETTINECVDRDCAPNGKCIIGLEGSNTCECNPDFTGENCEQRIQSDLCAGVTCNGNGHCMTGDHNVMMFICICDSGYTGTSCEISIDPSLKSNNSIPFIGPVVGGTLGAIVFLLTALVTVVLIVLLLRRKQTYNIKGLSNTAVRNDLATDGSNITESTEPLVSPKPATTMGKSTLDRDFENPIYGGSELPEDNVYDQLAENVYSETIHDTVHSTQVDSEPVMLEDHEYDVADINLETSEALTTTKLKDERVCDGFDLNQRTLRNFKNPVYGDQLAVTNDEEELAKLKTLKNLKNPIYGANDTLKQSRPHEYADVGPVYACLENEHDRAERYASKAAVEFKISVEGGSRGSTVGVGMETEDNRLYEDVV